MPAENPSSDRFRSATEFPQSINHLNATQANQIYIEMRSCLIFTNRSRSQLIRRNEEHKQTALNLRSDIVRLQTIVNQLNLEKQNLAQNQQATISELTNELSVMTGHLDQLSKAFEDVEGINNPMGVMAIPGRFSRFWQALKALIIWWRDEYGEDNQNVTSLPTVSQNLSESDRRDNPQMYTDPASIQRSERDW